MSVLYPGIGTARCGGTLITARYVLTAAHCVSDQIVAPQVVPVPADHVTVEVGSNDRTAGIEATAEKVLLNPGWDWMLSRSLGLPPSDYALVKLSRPVPARLMAVDTRQVHPSDRLRLIGWGLTTFPAPPGSPLPTMLQQRDVTVLPSSACAGGAIGVGEMCTSPAACFGDSGSPALRANHTGRHPRWQQVGLASRETTDPQDPEANPCHAPMIYTDLTHPPFRAWIRDTIRTETTKPCLTQPTVRSLTSSDRQRIDQLKPLITR